MAVRYMGTKRHIAKRVRRLIEDSAPSNRVVDLFSGMGNVSENLSGYRSIIANDALSFAAGMSRARFTGPARRRNHVELVQVLRPAFLRASTVSAKELSAGLKAERKAIAGTRLELDTYISEFLHVGNSDEKRSEADTRSRQRGISKYRLATLYFAGGYCSLAQAIEIDAIRYSIDLKALPEERDWLLGAWISALSIIINSPGHTAQFLKPNSELAAQRIARTWTRGVWDLFVEQVRVIEQVGDEDWRSDNEVFVEDALILLKRPDLVRIGAIYADPPYTRDQYSRYYHVYETLYKYDFPESSGEGRNRPDRFSTGFSLKSGVIQSFTELFTSVSRIGVPLVLSYPSNGLLQVADASVEDLSAGILRMRSVETFAYDHSTMGASSGAKSKMATENIYVLDPA